MENNAKKYGEILCFTPMAMFALWTVYFFSIVREQVVTSSIADHILWVTGMINNYTSLGITLALVATVTFCIMMYMVIHIARLKDMPAGNKIFWMVLLPALGAFGFIAFWYYELRAEPKYIDVYPSIE